MSEITEIRDLLTKKAGIYNTSVFVERKGTMIPDQKNLAEIMPGICNRLGIENIKLDKFFCYRQVIPHIDERKKEKYEAMLKRYATMPYLAISESEFRDFVIPFRDAAPKVSTMYLSGVCVGSIY